MATYGEWWPVWLGVLGIQWLALRRAAALRRALATLTFAVVAGCLAFSYVSAQRAMQDITQLQAELDQFVRVRGRMPLSAEVVSGATWASWRKGVIRANNRLNVFCDREGVCELYAPRFLSTVSSSPPVARYSTEGKAIAGSREASEVWR